MIVKRWVDLAKAVVLPAIVLAVVTADHYEVFDYLTGLTEVEKVSDRFNHSYTPDASAPVYMNDSEWGPTLHLIKKYSTAQLRHDKQPRTIARFRASLSTKETNNTFEWTSPSTPFAVMYRVWPDNTGTPLTVGQDFVVVGTIGDLQNWIRQERNVRHFLLHDILFGLAAIFLGYWVWRLNHT